MNDSLRDRIILAVLDTLTDSDPIITIAVGGNDVRISHE